MSRDPEDPKLRDSKGMPIDPKKLHKYLYAEGDPVNLADPRGRDAIIAYAIENGETEAGVIALEEAKIAVQDELRTACIERVLAEMGPLEMYQGFGGALLYDIAVGDCTILIAAVP